MKVWIIGVQEEIAHVFMKEDNARRCYNRMYSSGSGVWLEDWEVEDDDDFNDDVGTSECITYDLRQAVMNRLLYSEDPFQYKAKGE